MNQLTRARSLRSRIAAIALLALFLLSLGGGAASAGGPDLDSLQRVDAPDRALPLGDSKQRSGGVWIIDPSD